MSPHGSEIMKNSIFENVFKIGLRYPKKGLVSPEVDFDP